MSRAVLDRDHLRVAVVGCGYWGVNYLRVLNELAGVELAAICEPRVGRLTEVGALYPRAALYTDFDQLLAEKECDAVVIATGATTHSSLTLRALEAGRDVLVEKPLTTTSATSRALIEAAAKRERVLMVGHTFLYNAAVEQLKRYVGERRLGRIHYVYARRTNLGPIRHDVNVAWDLAPHDISVFNHLLDTTPEWVSATGTRLLRTQLEDVAFITLGYPNGIIANIHVSWVDPNKVRELVLVGSERRIVFDDTNLNEPVRVFDRGVVPQDGDPSGEFPYSIRDGDIVSPRIQHSEPLKNQVRHFLECVRSGERPRSTGEDGLAVVAVMEAIERSLKGRGAPVEVDLGTPMTQAVATASSGGSHAR